MGRNNKPLALIFVFFCLILSAQNNEDAKIKRSIDEGEGIYATNCLACHQEDGGGAGNMNPPLIQTSFVLGDSSTLIKVLLNGMSQVEINGESYYNVMPSFSYLSDADIAHVLSYVRNSFGNEASAVTVQEVASTRKDNDEK